VTATLVSLWSELRRRLQAAGVETPVLDARMLLEAAAGVSRLDIVTDPRRPMSAEQVAAVEALTQRREAREPVAHITGRKHFWTLDLAVSSDVLIPRPETEFLVEAALQALAPNAPARVLDLGVGSGAILFAVLLERPLASGVGVDISEAALAVARTNREALELTDRAVLVRGDWRTQFDVGFDAVLSNPPYIATAEIEALAPEVARFEPRIALDGGADGLDAYRTIIAELAGLLKSDGVFAFEVGRGQAEAVAALAMAAGLSVGEPWRDLAGAARVVWGRRAA
jgi:release factor glutamine methyltransferase